MGRQPNRVAPGVARPPIPDAAGVYIGLATDVIDGMLNVLELVPRIDNVANDSNPYGGFAIVVGFGHVAYDLQPAVAFAPAAVVDCEADEACRSQPGCNSTTATLAASPSMAQDNRGMLFIALDVIGFVQISGDSRTVTPDLDRFYGNRIRWCAGTLLCVPRTETPGCVGSSPSLGTRN